MRLFLDDYCHTASQHACVFGHTVAMRHCHTFLAGSVLETDVTLLSETRVHFISSVVDIGHCECSENLSHILSQHGRKFFFFPSCAYGSAVKLSWGTTKAGECAGLKGSNLDDKTIVVRPVRQLPRIVASLGQVTF